MSAQSGLPARPSTRLRKMLSLATIAITSFSYLPLQLATMLGFSFAFLSLVGIFLTIILRLSGNLSFQGQATTLVSVLFLGGIQLIFSGHHWRISGSYLR
jgi:uncharacterized membrane protein YqjE